MDLCADASEQERVEKQLHAFMEAFDASDTLRSVLLSPVISHSEKQGVISALAQKLGLNKTMKNFLLVLLDHDRFGELRAVSGALRERIDAAANRVRATITSAVALDKGDLDVITREIERLTGKDVIVTARVDASLIGGVVTQIGNVVLDGSVRTDLEMLRESLLG